MPTVSLCVVQVFSVRERGTGCQAHARYRCGRPGVLVVVVQSLQYLVLCRSLSTFNLVSYLFLVVASSDIAWCFLQASLTE
jgi:hypothetical protein